MLSMTMFLPAKWGEPKKLKADVNSAHDVVGAKHRLQSFNL